MLSFGKEANIRTQPQEANIRFVCNLGPRALPVEHLPVIAHGCEGRKGWSPWLGSHAAQNRTLVLWHRALGHNNFNEVARLTKLVDGVHIRKEGAAGYSDTCAEEKAWNTCLRRGTRVQITGFQRGVSQERHSAGVLLTLHRRIAKACGSLSQEWRVACSRRRVSQNNSGLMLWLHLYMSKTDVSTLRTTVRRMKCSLARGQT